MSHTKFSISINDIIESTHDALVQKLYDVQAQERAILDHLDDLDTGRLDHKVIDTLKDEVIVLILRENNTRWREGTFTFEVTVPTMEPFVTRDDLHDELYEAIDNPWVLADIRDNNNSTWTITVTRIPQNT